MGRIRILLVFFICLNTISLTPHAITYQLNGGRLGDHIYSFCLAKWLAYKYEMEFYYVPFEYSDAFFIAEYEKKLTKQRRNKFEKIIRIRTEDDLVHQLKTVKKNALFSVQFLAKINGPLGMEEVDPLMRGTVATNWLFLFMKQIPEFEKEIKRDLKFRHKPKFFNLPKNMITVAIHVRKGGGFDAPLISCQYTDKNLVDNKLSFCKELCQDQPGDRRHPLKFPPEQYYVDQIIKFSDMLNNSPIFACVFTDDQDPEGLVKRFEQRINRSNIKLVSAHGGYNIFQESVLDDMYHMSCFDCLIKSSSHFAWVAQLIGEHKMIIYPQWAEWDEINNMNNVTKVGAFFNNGFQNGAEYVSFNEVSQNLKKNAARYLFTENLKYLRSL